MPNTTQKYWLLAEYWATSTTVEVAQNAFLQAGSIGCEIDDGALPEGQKKYVDDRVLLKAYFEPAPGLAEQVEEVFKLFFAECGFSLGPLVFSDFACVDWQRNFVLSCTTFKVEPDIFIVPSFEIEQFKKNHSGELFIEMDPENAFGTGQHQTTKLCLGAICEILSKESEADRQKLFALDVGCGSGILAILLKKLKVGQVVASENDPTALETAGKNAQKNGVNFDLVLVDDDYSYVGNKFDIVVANILAPVLIDMAQNLVGTCKLGGKIILSGILRDQADLVIAAYESCEAKLYGQKFMDDWCTLIFTHR